MISRYFRIAIVCTVAAIVSAPLSGCQKVSVPRVSSQVGDVDETCKDFVTHYLDTDPRTFASSQTVLKNNASPGCINAMMKAGVLAKSPKELKAKTAQLAKNKVPATVVVRKVQILDVSANGLIPVTVEGVTQKGTAATPFQYKLTLGLRKDNGKLAVVTITKM